MTHRQPIASCIVGRAHDDGRLIRRACGIGAGQPVGEIIDHGQHAIGIGHARQVPNEVVLVAGDLTARQRFTQQLIHRIVGKADGLRLRRHPREEIIVAIVAVSLHFAQRIGRGQQPVAVVIGEGGCLVLGVLHREQIAVAVIGVLRDPVEWVRDFLQPVLRIVFKGRAAVEGVFRAMGKMGRESLFQVTDQSLDLNRAA